ncbi:MAG: hypothetical protein IJ184_07235 [Alphaproteobacteria bacterium]|nr:hypothetical protein [Alphaproteobacteria bacterium]
MANIDHPATLQELSVEYAKKQPHQIEYLTEESPILARIKFEAASHPLWDISEVVTDIKGAGFVQMNAPLPKVSVDSKLEKEDLNIMGGEIFVPEDKAQALGGEAKYFADKMPKILRLSGNDTEKHILYENYLQYMIDNEKVVSAGGGAASTGKTGLYSMLIVRSVPGENGGLYSPTGFKNGAMLDVKPINNGALYHDDRGVLGFGVRLKGYFGMRLKNPKTVAGIVNISKSKLPTITQINEALVDAQARPGNTAIYLHPRLKGWLETEYKKEILRTTNGDKALNFLVSTWNEIPLISSYNFNDGDDKAVSFE